MVRDKNENVFTVSICFDLNDSASTEGLAV